MSDSLIHAIAGAAGGVVSMSATYPLVVLSTRAAVESKKHGSKSTLDAVKHILREEGVSGIYSGLTSSLLGIAVTNGIYYYYYEFTKSAIARARPGSAAKGLSTLESMLAGLIAGSATTVISNPIWVIQTTQAVRAVPPTSSATGSAASEKKVLSRKPGIIETAKAIMRQSGLAGFWRGVMPALVLVINPIIQYTVFEQLKNLLVSRRTAVLRARGSPNAARLTDMDFFWLGALSKLVATSVTYPYIVLKSRLQSGHTTESKQSSLRALLHIVKEEGIEGLYRGISSKLLQSVLTAAILFASQKKVYDLTKAMLGRVAA